MTVKEKVLDSISQMPDDSTLDDIGYRLYVLESIEGGLKDLDQGNYVTHEEAGAELGRWLKK